MRKLFILVVVCGLAASASWLRAEDKESDEGDEQKVAFTSTPQAVQTTLTKEGDGNKIDQVDKENHKGKIIYEADVQLNGKNYEIKVAEDGTLISKKLDEEEKEHKDNGKESDEKNEKK